MAEPECEHEDADAAVGISLAPDVRLLFVTRALRLVGYGSISIVLVLYLAELHLGWR